MLRAGHSLVLAEGVPAESYVDNVEHLAFDNWEEHEALYGDLPGIPEMDLPRAKAHRQVPMTTRQRLAARAAGSGIYQKWERLTMLPIFCQCNHKLVDWAWL